jgi:hypothetical protein
MRWPGEHGKAHCDRSGDDPKLRLLRCSGKKHSADARKSYQKWIKRFLSEYLPGDSNFARNTQPSYRDALRLLVVFASAALHRKPDELLVEDRTIRCVRCVP